MILRRSKNTPLSTTTSFVDTTNQLLQTTLGPIIENEKNIAKSGRGTKKMGTMFAPITHSEFIEDYF